VAGACYFFPSVVDAERAEILACRRAVQLAREAGVLELVLATGSYGVVTKLRIRNLDRSIHGPLIKDVKDLLDGFDGHQVVHVKHFFFFFLRKM
jgi:hypothetical protein